MLVGSCATKSKSTAVAATTTKATTTLPPTTTTTKGGTTATKFHMSHLADHESPGIASQLTTVPGYQYTDVSAGAIAAALDQMHGIENEAKAPGFFRSMSLHSVVADNPSRNTANGSTGSRETGFLQLREFSSIPSGEHERDAALLGVIGLVETGQNAVGGTKYYVFRNDVSTDSKWVIVWIRHGVQGAFDGATLPEVEQWVRAYLARPELQPDESDALGRALLPVQGWTYGNWWETNDLVLLPSVFGATSSASIHAVLTMTGGCCALLLAVPAAGTTIDDIHPPFAPTAGARTTETIAGTPTRRDTDGDQVAVVWTDGSIAALCIGPDGAAVDKFVRAYLTEKQSPHTADT